jgi:hypothetical protein
MGSPPTSAWSLITGDFNGDGKTDFAFLQNTTLSAYLSNGDGTFTTKPQTLSENFGAPPVSPTSPYFMVEGNLNGDNRSDFALVTPGNASGQPGEIYPFLSAGDGTFTQLSPQQFPFVANSPASFDVIQGDFKDNGLTDFAIVSGDTIRAFLSNGNGNFSEHTQTIAQNFGTPPSNWTPITGDFTGNGKTDFAMVTGDTSGNTVYTYLSNGDGTFSVVEQSIYGDLGAPPSAYWSPIIGDFNGDGKTDVSFITGSSSGNQVATWLSNGDGTFSTVGQTIYGDLGSPPSALWTPVTGDFNGDGMTDVSFVTGGGSGNQVATWLSNGDGTFRTVGQTIYGDLGSPPSALWTPVTGDFIGNGNTDVAFISGSTSGNSIATLLAEGPQPDLLTFISNGIGATTTITYGTLAEGYNVYYAGWNNALCESAPASYPTEDFSGSLPVVTNTSSNNGIGGQYQKNYTYGCARVDVSGRGFLGFYSTWVGDPQTGVDLLTYYLQSYPYIGLVSSQTKTVGSVTVSSVANTYGTLTSSTTPALPWDASNIAPWFPFISKSVVSGSDLNGAALPTTTTTYTYDSYGDPLTIAISKMLGSTQGPTQTTTNTYQTPNTTVPNWRFGKVITSQVVSTTP